RNPRAIFPARDDFIRSAWVRRARAERAQEYEELYPYFSARPATDLGSAAAAALQSTAAAATAPEKTSQKAPDTRHAEVPSGLMPPTKGVGNGVSGPTSTRARSAAPAAGASIPYRGSRNERHMGVGTGPRNVAEMRRAFRRLEPEKMFRAPRADGEPIWAYWGEAGGGDGDRGHGRSPPSLPPGKRARTEDGFVLVPAKDLKELRRMEGALRRERGVLNAHCLTALAEGEVSAHRPLELTRMAVHGACGREMADALREYRSWIAKNRGSGGRDGGGGGISKAVKRAATADPETALARYKASLTAVPAASGSVCGAGKRAREVASKERVAELRRTPAGWRALRWVMMQRQAELRNQAAETAAMFSEEMEQRHKESRYQEAWERRHDYDLYCVLAGQFWPLEAEAFRSCTRPGKKLFLDIQSPARVIHRMWKKCWPFRKDRKRRGCIGLQALWRGRLTRKRWRPIVRLRIRHGRRSIIHPCFSSWTRFARVRRWARRRFEEIEGHWERACFAAWAEWTSNRAAEKQRKLERAGRTLRNIAAYRSFRSWKTYTSTTHRAHQLYARAVGYPSMAAWIIFVDEARRQRKRRGAAVTIQRHARGYSGRIRYRATRTIILGFNRLINSRRARRFLRQALAAAHRMAAEELLQSGCDAEITAGVAREEKRLAKMQKELRAADAAVRRAVTRRLNGGWFSSATRLASRHSSSRGEAGGGGGGRGELRREIKAVREEWKALDAEAAAATAASASLQGRTAPTSATSVEGAATRSSTAGGGFGGTWPKLGLSGLLAGKGKPKARDAVASRTDDGRDNASAGGGETRSEAEAAATTGGGRAGGGTQAPAAHSHASRSAEEAEREARRRILARDRAFARDIVVHDFDVRNPPPLKCCAPGCGATFTRDEHYLAHWDSDAAGARRVLLIQPDDTNATPRPGSPRGTPHRRATRGSPKTPSSAARPGRNQTTSSPSGAAPATAVRQPLAQAGHPGLGGEDIASFHLVVADKAEPGAAPPGGEPGSSVSGFGLLSAYITRVWGRGVAHNTLLFVDAIERWRRRSLTTEPGFLEGAAFLRREFLCPGAPRGVSLPEDARRGLMRVLDALPEHVLEDPAAVGGAGRGWGVGDGLGADDDDGSVRSSGVDGTSATARNEADGPSGGRPVAGSGAPHPFASSFVRRSAVPGASLPVPRGWTRLLGVRFGAACHRASPERGQEEAGSGPRNRAPGAEGTSCERGRGDKKTALTRPGQGDGSPCAARPRSRLELGDRGSSPQRGCKRGALGVARG
ncbi:unnamed protein product, partial [Scytosiphon promiscuus]